MSIIPTQDRPATAICAHCGAVASDTPAVDASDLRAAPAPVQQRPMVALDQMTTDPFDLF